MIPSLLPSELHHIRKTFLWSFTPHLCLQCRVGTVWCLLSVVDGVMVVMEVLPSTVYTASPQSVGVPLSWWSQSGPTSSPPTSSSPSASLSPATWPPHLKVGGDLVLTRPQAGQCEGGIDWQVAWTVQVRPPWGLPWHWNVNKPHHYRALTWSS